MEEQVLYTARTHPKILFRALMMQLVLLVAHGLAWYFWPERTGWNFFDSWGSLILHSFILIIEVWYVFIPVLRWYNTSFTLTNRRVKSNWGVLYKQSREIDLTRIASISEERGILDRIFGCGTLNFYDAAAVAQPRTSGAWNRALGEQGVSFHDVPKVKQVRAMVEQAKYATR